MGYGYLQKKNNCKTTLNGSITSGSSIVVTSASTFPASFPFRATIWDKVTYPDPTDDPNMEIVHVTSVSTNTYTVTRAQEGTANVNHASGQAFELLLTAADLAEYESYSFTFTNSSLSSGVLTVSYPAAWSALASPYQLSVDIFDNNSNLIIPDSIVPGASSVVITLLSYGTLPSTWSGRLAR